MLIFFVKSQLALFDAPVNVAAHVRKDGTVVKPHVRIQKVTIKQPSLFDHHHAEPAPAAKPKRTKLDTFLTRYGGAAGMAKILAGLPEGQQQQLIAKMAEVGKTTPEAVAEMLAQGAGAQKQEPTGTQDLFSQPAEPEKKPEPVKAKKPDPAPEPEPELPLVEHTTGKGKTLRGVVRTDLTQAQAKEIDPYTFRKNGGWFIREKHLGGVSGTAPAATAEPAAEVDAEAQARAAATAAVEKSKAQAVKLREAGEKLLAESEAHHDRDRLTNTARRVRFAAAAERAAADEIRIAKTMINLASAIEDGDARHLAGVSTKAAVKTLETELQRAIYTADKELSYPDQQRQRGRDATEADIAKATILRPKWGTAGTSLTSVLDAIKGKRGAPALAAKLRYSDGPTPELAVELRKVVDAEMVKSLLGWWNVERLQEINRLQKLGIDSDDQLREALREFVQYRGGHKVVDPIKAAERALVGQKVGVDFFPTPKTLAASMATAAGITAGMRVLEPSAGNGHLADAAKAAGADVDTVEISDTLRNILQAKGHNLAGRDFESFEPAVKYDAVLMNPPFSDRKDAEHIMRAMDMVKPGGKLVAIAGEGVFFGSDKKAVAFREWLDEHGAEVEMLPAGTFMGADLPVQTGANARLIKMTKAAEAKAAEPATAAPAVEDGPKDGDLNADGLVFRNGRWHRDGEQDGSVFDWEDREAAPVGAWVRADFAVGGDHPVYQVRDLPIDSLFLHELDNDGRLQPEKRRYLPEYVERAKSGEKPPSITVIEMEDGRLKVADGHRRTLAARDAGLTTIRGLVSPLLETPDGKKEATESMLGASEALDTEVSSPSQAAPTEADLAEDREDLATELTRNPHSDKAKAMLAEAAAKHAKAEAPAGADEDDPGSENYRYADTGYVAGSRKEQAAANVIARAKRDGAQVMVQHIDWESMEANPREAKELITKSNLFGVVPWGTLREHGMEPGAGFVIDRIYAAIGTEPKDDNAQARKDYTLGLQTLRNRLEACKTAQEVSDVLDDLQREYDGKILNAEESAAFAKVQEAKKPIGTRLREISAERDAKYGAANTVALSLREMEQKQSARTRRGWKPDAELAAGIAKLKPKVDAARAEYGEALKVLNKERDELEAQYRTLYDMQERIEQTAYARNKIENPLHRAWNIMGERFVNVLRYRKHDGSDAFYKHLATAKAGGVKDWSWSEKEGATKAPKIKKESARFQMKVADSYKRKGGRDVKPDSTMALKNQFGLRDVQSGNWVLRDEASAKFHVEQSAAAMADLADLIGIPDEQVSFNGRLALAFGARGRGNAGGSSAAAHYEPVHRVINMTKMAGGGALAHELFHAWDNMVKEAMGGDKAGTEDFASERPDLVPEGPLRDAFKALRDALHDGEHQAEQEHIYTAADYTMAQRNMKPGYYGLSGIAKQINAAGNLGAALDTLDKLFDGRGTKKNAKAWRTIAIAHYGGSPDGGTVMAKHGPKMSSFKKEARILDSGSKKEYYSEGREMSARAFQSWVEDRLEGMGRQNDYLSWGADNKYHRDPLTGMEWKPFPEGEERERINAAFDRLMAAFGEQQVLAKAMAAW